ncbi:MAG: carbohydrate ABC transporter permease [Phycisphaerales bacterium]
MQQGFSLLPYPPSSAVPNISKNYSAVLNDQSVDFPLYLRNTIVVVSLGIVGCVVSSVVVAYGLARVPMPCRKTLLVATVATMLIPFPVLMAPLFLLYSKIGWIGTFLPLYAQFWLGNAFSIFLLHQFFRSMPKELDEAARVDGCGYWQTFRYIALPLSKTAIAVVVLLHFTYMWNDFLAPLVFIVDRDKFTLMLGLQLYQSKAGQTPWNLLMAASTLTLLPILVIFVITNKMFTRASMMGAIKG